MNIFDMARNRVAKYYQAQTKHSPKDAEILKHHDMYDIDFEETESTKGVIPCIKSNFTVWWKYCISENMRVAISSLWVILGIVFFLSVYITRPFNFKNFIRFFAVLMSEFCLVLSVLVLVIGVFDFIKGKFSMTTKDTIIFIILTLLAIPAIIVLFQ